MKLTLLLFAVLLASVPVFGNITYTCAANIDGGADPNACATLNSTVSGYYSSTFSNANAKIYITMGTTGLGSSSQYFNFMSYSSYVAALTGNPNQDALQASACPQSLECSWTRRRMGTTTSRLPLLSVRLLA